MNLKSHTQKLVLIDVHALVHRAYHAFPPHLSVRGQQVNAAYGFSALMLEILEKFHPEYVMSAVDIGKPTRRLKIFKDYKATRKPTDPELISQFPIVHEIIDAFNIPIYKAEGYEADDLIGSIVNMKNIENRKDLETIIVTGDKDLFQLVDKNTYVYLSGSAFSKSKLYGIKEVKEKMGFGPELVVDYKSLRGDASDNIPGVAGIGEKSALILIKKYGSLENILKNREKVEQNRIKNALEKGIEEAKLSRKLAEIETDIDINFDLAGSKPKLESDNIIRVFKKYEFKSLIRRLKKLNGTLDADGKNSGKEGGGENETENKAESESAEIKGKTPVSRSQQSFFPDKPDKGAQTDSILRDHYSGVDYTVITEKNKGKEIARFAKQLGSAKIFAFDTETDSLASMASKTLGLSIAFKPEQAYYITNQAWEESTVLRDALAKAFENPKIMKIGHNIKFDIHSLLNAGFRIRGELFDTMIAAFLLQMGQNSIGLKSLAFHNFGMEMMEYKDLLELANVKGRLESVPLDLLGKYACADADATSRLYEVYREWFKREKKMKKLYERIEMPLINVLVKMERRGIKLDVSVLKKLAKDFDEQIADLQEKIIGLAGVQFNLNSPKQLAEVLYGKLKLPVTKKTSSGALSTNERVLRELREHHEIIDLILGYREIAKLRSTYTDALIKQVNKETGRVHSSFSQSVTSTGRLSSSDPNLQNIPVASELGNKIRQAFVPDNGRIFVSLDYSQQELRILAGVSRDGQLMSSYKKDVDVHKLTASKLFGVEIDQVTKSQRSAAKTVNFSIIYGISAFGLSDRLKIPRKKAQEFIDKYFELYPGVKEYFDKLLEESKKVGFAETPFGRRRDASGLASQNFRVRGAVEREVLNFPIQGGAAEMLKLAMVDLEKELSKNSSKWEGYDLLLQVHDELVFEAPLNGLDKVSGKIKEDRLRKLYTKDRKLQEFVSIVKKHMLSANKYDVPMKVDLGLGTSWGGVFEV